MKKILIDVRTREEFIMNSRSYSRSCQPSWYACPTYEEFYQVLK